MTDEERLAEIRQEVAWAYEMWARSEVQFLLREIDRLRSLLASQEARLRVQGEIIEGKP